MMNIQQPKQPEECGKNSPKENKRTKKINGMNTSEQNGKNRPLPLLPLNIF